MTTVGIVSNYEIVSSQRSPEQSKRIKETFFPVFDCFTWSISSISNVCPRYENSSLLRKCTFGMVISYIYKESKENKCSIYLQANIFKTCLYSMNVT